MSNTDAAEAGFIYAHGPITMNQANGNTGEDAEQKVPGSTCKQGR
jgi:hypothetical protein